MYQGDRNYASYRLLEELEAIDFVIRCSANSVPVARPMLKGPRADSQVVNLKNNKKSRAVRWVRVTLSTGEDEVLVTSLLDELTYPNELFKELYYWRWGIETGYSFLQNTFGIRELQRQNG